MHLTGAELEMTTGMANAAYCFGTVLSIQLLSRLRPRRLLVVLVLTLVAASAVAAWAPSAGLFVAGRVVQGLATSTMLIAAVPPLVTGRPRPRMRPTAMTMNLAIFGAVALGPVGGGVAVGAVVAFAIWIAGRARLRRPDIEPWPAGERPAISSPPLGRR